MKGELNNRVLGRVGSLFLDSIHLQRFLTLAAAGSVESNLQYT